MSTCLKLADFLWDDLLMWSVFYLSIYQWANFAKILSAKKRRDWTAEEQKKKGFYRLVTVWSNCTFTFVFNKTFQGGWGLRESLQSRVIIYLTK
jgi:hypothetical protein